MVGLIDLHSHALFGVDDGAESMEACMQMLGAAYSDGVRAICFTPHYNPSRYRATAKEVYEAYERVCAAASRRFPDLALLLGNEIYAYPGSLEALEAGDCRTLGGGRRVLLEFPLSVAYRDMRNVFLAYITAGYQPVLAHAERYAALREDVGRVKELVDMRVAVQINAQSILQIRRFRTYRFVRSLLSMRLVHAVASDMHNLKNARLLGRAFRVVLSRYGESYAKQLFYSNPKRILLRKQGED